MRPAQTAKRLLLSLAAAGPSDGDTTPGGATDVILLSGTTASGILLAGGVAGYLKKAG